MPTSAPAPPPKESKKAQKRKQREISPDDIPLKKLKSKHKESQKELAKDSKAAKEPKSSKQPKESKDANEPKELKEIKEPKEIKDKGKAPAKTPSKTPAKEDEPNEATPNETPAREKPGPPKAVPNDSPPLLRKPLEGELEAGGEIEGLITEEMARHHNLPATLIGQVVEKRKGPGRPPKDGIMSKRQRSQLIKQAKEIEKAKAAGIDPADIPMPSMKAKPAKRKDSNTLDGEEGDILETTENGEMGDRKMSKPSKPPRTPSPEPRMEDYTEEQLQRPTANYVVLIHEAISSSPTGQMNLQQIYNYIERKYPWYKFKTTTSGWQSSVRHNLGQHDAFVKGDKEGKGFNWKVNTDVSIEKERRKRQVSPPANHAQRQPYYPPPNGYAPYPQPGYPYHPGMAPHTMPPAAPRLPPSLSNPQPRLPPSMARDANATTPAATQGAPHPSPYASPWASGNTAGSPSAPKPPQPYPQPNSQTPPVSSAGTGSGQYGVLYPTSASQSYSGPPTTASPYGGPYATSNASPSPYGPALGQTYTPYAQPGQQPGARPPYPPPSQGPPQGSSHMSQAHEEASSGRYLSNTHPDLIRQLEAFRKVYLEARTEPGEDRKVDNAIRAYVDLNFPRARLTPAEVALYNAISSIEQLDKYGTREPPQQQPVQAMTNPPIETNTTSADTAAAIAADAAANTAAPATQTQPAPSANFTSQTATPQPPNKPQKYTPNITSAAPTAPIAPSAASSLRPSVEPLTPVPGSPAVQDGPLPKRVFTEIPPVSAAPADDNSGAEEPKKVDCEDAPNAQVPMKVDDTEGVEKAEEDCKQARADDDGSTLPQAQ